MTRRVFLPGVGADPHFWRPVAALLPPGDDVFMGWPGLGAQPPQSGINSYEDLIALVCAQLAGAPVDLIAQSMGGALAVRIALRHPDKIRRLVLTATSGGVDTHALGASDWRPGFLDAFPDTPDWALQPQPDLSPRLGDVRPPALLLWGDNDPISPVSVGEYLRDHLPEARLHVVRGGGHDLALTHAADIAPLIAAHLAS